MKNLQITNSRFITYTDDLLTVDVLGGVDLSQVERMVCTLRITYNDYPPQRTTLDLYNDNQTDKLQRTLCDKWGLKLLEASRSLYTLTLQLEEYLSFRLPACFSKFSALVCILISCLLYTSPSPRDCS